MKPDIFRASRSILATGINNLAYYIASASKIDIETVAALVKVQAEATSEGAERDFLLEIENLLTGQAKHRKSVV